MSIHVISWALKQKTGSSTAKLVLIKLADNADHTGFCWPSLEHIAEETELSRRAVIDNIRKLEKLGLVSVTRRKTEGVNLPNRYQLAVTGEVHKVRKGSERRAPEPISEPSDYNKKRSPIPTDFGVSEGVREAATHHRWANPDKELEPFRDWALAHGHDSSNWDAAFKTYLRKVTDEKKTGRRVRG